MARQFENMSRLIERDPALKFRTDEHLGVVRHLRGHLADAGSEDPGTAQRVGIEFVAARADMFGDIDTKAMNLVMSEPDPVGGANVILEQQHGGHRVVGGTIRFHTDRDGTLDTISNRLFPDLAEVPTEPEVDAERAVEAVREATRSRSDLRADPELVVIRSEGRPYLAWEIKLDTDDQQRGEWGEPTQWVAYVDGRTGDLIQLYNNIQTAGPVVGNGTGYYSGAGSVNAWSDDTTYQLRDTTRTAAGGPEVRTNDEDGASPSADPDDNWNDLSTSPRDANQGAETDAHRFSAAVVDYFRNTHGRVSFDGAGGTHTNLVHFGSNYNNGYWDGSKVNLGDGTGSAPGDDYECTDDWLAHEWTHAYTEHTCALVYNAESGALNESFSDVFAAFITGDWLVFEDSWLKTSAPAWRNMIDPTNGGQWNVTDPLNSVLAGHQPSHYTVRYVGGIDSGGVHINSGIINNLFYLLTVGGSHTVSHIAVAGIGQAAAQQMLWRCMTVNLVGQPNATFLQFREAMLDACVDLFPTDHFKLAQVKSAFNAVGVGPDIYIRDNLADSGAEPNPSGILSMSPDIINRTSPVGDPTVDLGDLANGTLGQNVEFGQDNQLYVRLQNRGPQPGDATVRVFFTPATAFATPGSWTFIGSLAAAGLASGSATVVGPLVFPAAMIPAPGHYCLIAVTSSSVDPAPDLNLIASVADFVSYVRDCNNIAWRNYDVVDDIQPGEFGILDVLVHALGEDIAGYGLRINTTRFFAGARVRVRGPAKLLSDAVATGLRRVDDIEDEAVFELGNRPLREPLILDRLASRQVGFAQLNVTEDFRLRVEFHVPKEPAAREIGRAGLRAERRLRIDQYHKDRLLGSAGLIIRVPPG